MKKCLLVLLLITNVMAFAQDDNLTIVAVGEATLDKDKMVIQDPYISAGLTVAQKNAANELVKLIRNDFSFYQKKFYLIEAAPNNTAYRQNTNYDYWNSKGVRFLGTASVDKSGENMKVNVVFEDIKNHKQIYNQTLTANLSTIRQTGHEMANGAYKHIIGKDSIFTSKIIFISDRNSRGRKTVKEVYMMDFDGKNVQQITNHGGIAISPTMSYDGKYLVYSVIGNEKKRNVNLYLMNMKTREAEVISQKDGINSGAVFFGQWKKYRTYAYEFRKR
jgi:TolB protein